MDTWIFPDVPSKRDLWSGGVYFNPSVCCCFCLLIPCYFFSPLSPSPFLNPAVASFCPWAPAAASHPSPPISTGNFSYS